MINKLYLLCILAAVLPGCNAGDGQTRPLRYEYGNIIDISHTPRERARGAGWFCDQGSWMGFTIPEREAWVNGFCGPYDLDDRRWMARSAVEAGFNTPGKEVFTPDSTNYLPGEVFLGARSATGRITQRLQYVDASTVLLGIKSDTDRELRLTGEGWRPGTTFEVDENTVIAKMPGDGIVCITFSPDVKVECSDENYVALYNGRKECFVAISFADCRRVRSFRQQKLASVLENPQAHYAANDERWNGYLSKVLRHDMPHDYNRIAVKSVVTLISNWKTHKGGLLHEGVIPSHAVSYFNGFWAWDSWRFCVALAPIHPELAKNNMRAMFDYQLPDGMIIDCIYTDPAENNARDSKPPLAAWAVDAIFESTRDTAFLREMYPGLLAYHRWWYAERDHDGNGICEFGSVDGTLVAAKWESGMDNAIRFAEAQIKLLGTQLERQRILLEKDAVSRESFDKVQTDYNMVAADISLYKARIERTEVRASFNGTVGFRYASEGSFVQPGTKIARLVDNSTLKVEFSIPEKYISLSLNGREVAFQVEGFSQVFHAHVYAIDPKIDPKTRTIALRAEYDNSRELLMPGMFAAVTLITSKSSNSIQVPSEAVVPEMEGKSVWVVRNGKAVATKIETGVRSETLVEVTSGLSSGDSSPPASCNCGPTWRCRCNL